MSTFCGPLNGVPFINTGYSFDAFALSFKFGSIIISELPNAIVDALLELPVWLNLYQSDCNSKFLFTKFP